MYYASHESHLGVNTPERNRYITRMNQKHPNGWGIHYPSLNEGVYMTNEQVFGALNRVEDLIEADISKVDALRSIE